MTGHRKEDNLRTRTAMAVARLASFAQITCFSCHMAYRAALIFVSLAPTRHKFTLRDHTDGESRSVLAYAPAFAGVPSLRLHMDEKIARLRSDIPKFSRPNKKPDCH